jgi:hypothetical protein
MMRVLGKDRREEAYRVSVEVDGAEVVALVPDTLLSAEYGQTGKVTHEAAYEWIEAQAMGLRDAIAALHKGARPEAPFTDITLDAP